MVSPVTLHYSPAFFFFLLFILTFWIALYLVIKGTNNIRIDMDCAFYHVNIKKLLSPISSALQQPSLTGNPPGVCCPIRKERFFSTREHDVLET